MLNLPNMDIKPLTDVNEVIYAFCEKRPSDSPGYRKYFEGLFMAGTKFFQMVAKDGKIHAQMGVSADPDDPTTGVMSTLEVQTEDIKSVTFLVATVIGILGIERLVSQTPLLPSGIETNKMKALGFYPQFSLWSFPQQQALFGVANKDVTMTFNVGREYLEGFDSAMMEYFKDTDAEEHFDSYPVWRLMGEDIPTLYGVLTDEPAVMNNLTIANPAHNAINNGHDVCLMLSQVMSRVVIPHPFNVVIPAVNTDYVIAMEKFPTQHIMTEYEFKGLF